MPFIKHRISLALAASLTVLPALAAPVNYDMNLRTTAGMGAGGVGGALGMMFGGKGGGVSKSMDLRLANPADIPADYTATHTVPEAMRIGPALPLKGERRGGESATSGERNESEPDGRILIYWGCSPTVLKGQPEIIDFKNLGKQVPPEVMAMAKAQRGGGKAGAARSESLPTRTVGWPWYDTDFRGIPSESSTVGDHVIKASFMAQDIYLKLGKELDFLEPINLKATSSDRKKTVPLAWDALGRARGYDLNAVGSNGDKEVVMWMAARNKSPMLPGSQHECTIPEGIFAKSEATMVSAMAHGPMQGFAFPPQKPGEKKPLIWTAKVRITGYDSLILGIQEAAGEAAVESAAPAGVGGLLKGIFGR